MYWFLGHVGEHSEVGQSWLDKLTHQPVPLSLLLIAILLTLMYVVLSLSKVKLVSRIFILLTVAMVLAVVYMTHAPLVSTVLLSLSFIVIFAVAFIQLSARHK